MHRSGTSALTGLLEMMGLHVGEPGELIPAKADNPKGFFERQGVFDIHHELLAELGATWDAPLKVIDELSSSPPLNGFVDRLHAHVQALNQYPAWVLKDPLLCLLFPLWRDLLDEPAAIVIHRSPVEVAQSLLERNGLPMQVGVALWELYTLMALEQTRDLRRCLVHHGRLLLEPNEVARELAGFLGRCGDRPRVPEAEEVRRFVDPALSRAKGDPSLRPHLLNNRRTSLLDALDRGELEGLQCGRQALSHDSEDLLLAFAELEDARSERVQALRERDSIFAEKNACLAQVDGLLAERERMLRESEQQRLESDRICQEKAVLLEQARALEAQRDQLLVAKSKIAQERDELLILKKRLLAESRQQVQERVRIEERVAQLQEDRDALELVVSGLRGQSTG